jgi:multisubunit Na+/H+ antiporter MnhB subunit
MVDIVLKVLALASFIVFLAFLPIYVPDLALIAVIVIVVAMATYDFLIRPALMRRRRS